MDLLWEIVFITALAGMGGTGLGGVVSCLFRKDSSRTVSLLLSFAGGVMTAVVCFDLLAQAVVMTKEDVNYLPALISENMKMLSFKYPKIAAFSQIEKFVNTPIEKNSPISKIDNLVNIILPASYKMFEQNIKKFEPETLRNTISIVAKNYVAAQSKSLNINKKDRDR